MADSLIVVEPYRCNVCRTVLYVTGQQRGPREKAKCRSCGSLVPLQTQFRADPQFNDWPLSPLFAVVLCCFGWAAAVATIGGAVVRNLGVNHLDFAGFILSGVICASLAPIILIAALTNSFNGVSVVWAAAVGLGTAPLSVLLLFLRAGFGYEPVMFNDRLLQVGVFVISGIVSIAFAVRLYGQLVKQGSVMAIKKPAPTSVPASAQPQQVLAADGNMDKDALIAPLQAALRSLMQSAGQEPGWSKVWTTFKARIDASMVKRQYGEAAFVIDEARRTFEAWCRTQTTGAEHEVRMADLHLQLRKLEMEIKRHSPETSADRAGYKEKAEADLATDKWSRTARADHHETIAAEWHRRREKIMKDYPDTSSPVRKHLLDEIDAVFTERLARADAEVIE